MQFLTDFADQAVILPLAAVIGLALAVSGWWRGCAAWVLTVCGVLGTIGVLKVVFFACANMLGDTGIRSPSGHTASAAAVMGGALVLWMRGRLPAIRVAALPVGLAIMFGISRVAVHAHTVPEVVVGGLIGLAGAGLLATIAGPRPPSRAWPAAVISVALLLMLHGIRLQAETALHGMALFGWLPLPATCRA